MKFFQKKNERMKLLVYLLILAMLATYYLPFSGSVVSAAAKPTFEKKYTHSYVSSSNTYRLLNLRSGYTVKWSISDKADGYVSFSKTDKTLREKTVTNDKAAAAVKVYTWKDATNVLNRAYRVKAEVFNKKGKKIAECFDSVRIGIDAQSIEITTKPENLIMLVGSSFDFNRKLIPAASCNRTFWIVSDGSNKELVNTKTKVKSGKVLMTSAGIFTPKEAGTYTIRAVAYRSLNSKVQRAVSLPVTIQVVMAPATPTPSPTPVPTSTPTPVPTSVPYIPPVVIPTTAPAESISITADGFTDDTPKIVNTDTITITGSIQSNTGIRKIDTILYSNSDSAPKTLELEGTNPFRLNSVPLAIGANCLSITACATNGTTVTKELVINRVNTTVNLSDHVIGFDSTTPEGLQQIKDIYDGIENNWTDDMGTTDDTSDDEYDLVVKESSPLMSYITDGTYQSGYIIYIPKCTYFPAGLTVIYRSHNDAYAAGFDYDSSIYEVIHTQTAGFADILKDDVSIHTTQIDQDNPIAFVLAPEDTDLYLTDGSSENRQLLAGESRLQSFSEEELNSVNGKGFQLKNLKTLFRPTFDFSDISNGSIVLDFNDAILYDKDGDKNSNNEENVTEGDRITLSGEVSLKNIKPTFGLDWSPSLSDPLPKQFISKLAYNQKTEVKCNIGGEIGNLSDILKSYKEKTNSFTNKISFAGMSLEGTDMGNIMILGAIGINLAGVQGANIRTIQSASVLVPFNPIVVIYIYINAEGKLSTQLVFDYEASSYREQGINVQKEGFVGSFGSCAQNEGTINYTIGNRNINIYDITCKSKNERNLLPVSTLSVEADGEAETSVALGGACGVMMGGIIPASVKADIGPRAKVTLKGKVTLSTGSAPVIEGEASLNLKLSLKAAADVNLVAKTFLGNPGIHYHKDLFEKIFLEYNLATTKLSGTVYAADHDRDLTNNPALDNVKVTLTKNDSVSIGNANSFEAATDINGNFEIKNISAGTYTLSVSKDGYVTYQNNDYEIEGTGKQENFYLDMAGQSASLSGAVTKADEDTNTGNNSPLPDITVTLTKIGSSTTQSMNTVTGADGHYTFTGLPFGLYEVTISDNNYIPITSEILISANTTIYNITLEAISNSYAGNGIASGKVINALSGQGVEAGLTLTVYKGYNLSTGEVAATASTGDNGTYSLNLPAGNYTVYVTDNRTEAATRYKNGYFNIKVLGNVTIDNQNGEVTPILSSGEIRIVLTWGEMPRDLDSHLTGPASSGSTFHTYYDNSEYCENGTALVQLDVDDTTSYGPETTTIYTQIGGIYHFSIHDYTNRNSTSSTALASSGACVKIYFGDAQLTYYVPNEEGTVWDVFEYNSNTGEFTVLNNMYYESDPSRIGFGNTAGTMLRGIAATTEDTRKDYEKEEGSSGKDDSTSGDAAVTEEKNDTTSNDGNADVSADVSADDSTDVAADISADNAGESQDTGNSDTTVGNDTDTPNDNNTNTTEPDASST